MIINDMPKLLSPFKRALNEKKEYVVILNRDYNKKSHYNTKSHYIIIHRAIEHD